MRSAKPALTTVTVLSLALGAASNVARADERPAFVHSARGPGAGEVSFSLGLRALMAVGDAFAFLPLVDFNLAYGIIDPLKLYLNIATIGLGTFTDLGLEFRLLGTSDGAVALAARAGVSPIFFFVAAGGDSAGGVIFAATPGLAFSVGSDAIQLTLGADFPMYLGGALSSNGISTSGTGFGPTLRPVLALEIPLGKVGLVVSEQAYIPLKGSADTIIMTTSLGLSW
ncbi:MAG: hypothetical protein IT384_30860 [Deltaproteobacteria bacterium]|nr:hypothetical protein [Deltaproteobacteria bacterium]